MFASVSEKAQKFVDFVAGARKNDFMAKYGFKKP